MGVERDHESNGAGRLGGTLADAGGRLYRIVAFLADVGTVRMGEGRVRGHGRFLPTLPGVQTPARSGVLSETLCTA